jgi:hypothetical protein
VVLLPTPMSPIQAREKHQQPPTNEHYTKYPPVTLKTVKGKKKKKKKGQSKVMKTRRGDRWRETHLL